MLSLASHGGSLFCSWTCPEHGSHTEVLDGSLFEKNKVATPLGTDPTSVGFDGAQAARTDDHSRRPEVACVLQGGAAFPKEPVFLNLFVS